MHETCDTHKAKKYKTKLFIGHFRLTYRKIVSKQKCNLGRAKELFFTIFDTLEGNRCHLEEEGFLSESYRLLPKVI